MNWVEIVMVVLLCVAIAAAGVFFVPKNMVKLDLAMFIVFGAATGMMALLAILYANGKLGLEPPNETLRPHLQGVSQRSAFAMGRHVFSVLERDSDSTGERSAEWVS